ncbi:uncharacterized protein [Panulirus ornatus]|uniref:uncharacterized protein n=1 Tax=Panulirus ornatus TaxID=150431 RepID=UPI003A8A519A
MDEMGEHRTLDDSARKKDDKLYTASTSKGKSRRDEGKYHVCPYTRINRPAGYMSSVPLWDRMPSPELIGEVKAPQIKLLKDPYIVTTAKKKPPNWILTYMAVYEPDGGRKLPPWARNLEADIKKSVKAGRRESPLLAMSDEERKSLMSRLTRACVKEKRSKVAQPCAKEKSRGAKTLSEKNRAALEKMIISTLERKPGNCQKEDLLQAFLDGSFDKKKRKRGHSRRRVRRLTCTAVDMNTARGCCEGTSSSVEDGSEVAHSVECDEHPDETYQACKVIFDGHGCDETLEERKKTIAIRGKTYPLARTQEDIVRKCSAAVRRKDPQSRTHIQTRRRQAEAFDRTHFLAGQTSGEPRTTPEERQRPGKPYDSHEEPNERGATSGKSDNVHSQALTDLLDILVKKLPLARLKYHDRFRHPTADPEVPRIEELTGFPDNEDKEERKRLRPEMLAAMALEMERNVTFMVTVSDDFGQSSMTYTLRQECSAEDIVKKVVFTLRQPSRRLPLHYYALFEVYTPHCMYRVPRLQKFRYSNGFSSGNISYLITRTCSHYKRQEDERLEYCRELLSCDQPLRSNRYTEVWRERLVELRAKITTATHMIRFLEMVNAGQLMVKGKIQEELVFQCISEGFPSDPLEELWRYRDQDDWETPNLTNLHFGEQLKHWYPDYGYLQRLWDYCKCWSIPETMKVLRRELQKLQAQYNLLSSTSPDTLFAEDESMLLSHLHEEGLKEQEATRKHKEFLKRLEKDQKRLSPRLLHILSLKKVMKGLKERYDISYPDGMVMTCSRSLGRLRALLCWQKLHGQEASVKATKQRIWKYKKWLRKVIRLGILTERSSAAQKPKVLCPRKKKRFAVSAKVSITAYKEMEQSQPTSVKRVERIMGGGTAVKEFREIETNDTALRSDRMKNSVVKDFMSALKDGSTFNSTKNDRSTAEKNNITALKDDCVTVKDNGTVVKNQGMINDCSIVIKDDDGTRVNEGSSVLKGNVTAVSAASKVNGFAVQDDETKAKKPKSKYIKADGTASKYMLSAVKLHEFQHVKDDGKAVKRYKHNYIYDDAEVFKRDEHNDEKDDRTAMKRNKRKHVEDDRIAVKRQKHVLVKDGVTAVKSEKHMHENDARTTLKRDKRKLIKEDETAVKKRKHMHVKDDGTVVRRDELKCVKDGGTAVKRYKHKHIKDGETVVKIDKHKHIKDGETVVKIDKHKHIKDDETAVKRHKHMHVKDDETAVKRHKHMHVKDDGIVVRRDEIKHGEDDGTLVKRYKYSHIKDDGTAVKGNKHMLVKDDGTTVKIYKHKHEKDDGPAMKRNKHMLVKDDGTTMKTYKHKHEKDDGTEVKRHKHMLVKDDGTTMKTYKHKHEKDDGTEVKRHKHMLVKDDGTTMKTYKHEKDDGTAVKRHKHMLAKDDGTTMKTYKHKHEKDDGTAVKRHKHMLVKDDGTTMKTYKHKYEKGDGTTVKRYKHNHEKDDGTTVKRYKHEKDDGTTVKRYKHNHEKDDETTVKRYKHEKDDGTTVKRYKHNHEKDDGTTVKRYKHEKDDGTTVKRYKHNHEKDDGTTVKRYKHEKDDGTTVKRYKHNHEKDDGTTVKRYKHEKGDGTTVKRYKHSHEKDDGTTVKRYKHEKDDGTTVKRHKHEKDDGTTVKRHKHKHVEDEGTAVKRHKHLNEEAALEKHKHVHFKDDRTAVKRHKHKHVEDEGTAVKRHKHLNEEAALEKHKHVHFKDDRTAVKRHKYKHVEDEGTAVKRHKHLNEETALEKHKHVHFKDDRTAVKRHKHKHVEDEGTAVKRHKHLNEEAALEKHKHVHFKDDRTAVKRHKYKHVEDEGTAVKRHKHLNEETALEKHKHVHFKDDRTAVKRHKHKHVEDEGTAVKRHKHLNEEAALEKHKHVHFKDDRTAVKRHKHKHVEDEGTAVKRHKHLNEETALEKHKHVHFKDDRTAVKRHKHKHVKDDGTRVKRYKHIKGDETAVNIQVRMHEKDDNPGVRSTGCMHNTNDHTTLMEHEQDHANDGRSEKEYITDMGNKCVKGTSDDTAVQKNHMTEKDESTRSVDDETKQNCIEDLIFSVLHDLRQRKKGHKGRTLSRGHLHDLRQRKKGHKGRTLSRGHLHDLRQRKKGHKGRTLSRGHLHDLRQRKKGHKGRTLSRGHLHDLRQRKKGHKGRTLSCGHLHDLRQRMKELAALTLSNEHSLWKESIFRALQQEVDEEDPVIRDPVIRKKQRLFISKMKLKSEGSAVERLSNRLQKMPLRKGKGKRIYQKMHPHPKRKKGLDWGIPRLKKITKRFLLCTDWLREQTMKNEGICKDSVTIKKLLLDILSLMKRLKDTMLSKHNICIVTSVMDSWVTYTKRYQSWCLKWKK